MIFVFGSNTSGIHGAGAASVAREQHGAVLGVGYGLTGNSFAIPTKDRSIRNTLSLPSIKTYVDGFLQFAQDRQDFMFQVTRIGCGLAGLRDEQIAPMFIDAPYNCLFDSKWSKHLRVTARYWGEF